MSKGGFREFFKTLIMPVLLFAALLSTAGSLLIVAELLFMPKEALIPHIKFVDLFAKIAFGAALFFASKTYSFEKIIKGTLCTFISALSLLLLVTWFSGTLHTSWVASSFHVVTSLVFSGFVALFVWGFLNNHCNFSEGVRYYLPVMMIVELLHGVVICTLHSPLTLTCGASFVSMVIAAIVFMGVAIVAFTQISRKLEKQDEKQSAAFVGGFSYLSTAFLIVGATLLAQQFGGLFMLQIKKQFANSNDYSEFMGYYSTILGVTGLIGTLVSVVFGTWLVVKKGWHTTALFGSIVVVLAGTLGLFLLSQSTLSTSSAVAPGLLKSVASSLFFPLAQMLYLLLPCERRFSTKVVTEMMMLPAIQVVGMIVFMMCGTELLYTQAAIAALMILFVCASRRIQFKVES